MCTSRPIRVRVLKVRVGTYIHVNDSITRSAALFCCKLFARELETRKRMREKASYLLKIYDEAHDEYESGRGPPLYFECWR